MGLDCFVLVIFSLPGLGASRYNDGVKKEIAQTEMEFEKRRGVNRVEVQPGYAQVHISGLGDGAPEGRLLALQLVKDSEVGIFFLKFSIGGLSFLVREEAVSKLKTAFGTAFKEFDIRLGCSIVFVHAINMRDEEGLLAEILSQAIASGANIEHIGDMHDRVCIACLASDAELIANAIKVEVSA